MYKNKLTPEEALSAIILRMKYDSKKTLNENLEMTEESLPRTDPDYKIAQEIWNGVGGAGTNTNKFLSGLKKIKTPQQFNKVNSQVAYFNNNLTIDEWVNDDFGSDDGEAVRQIIEHLKSIGITATAEFGTTGNFKENTFKITNIPSTPTPTPNTAAAEVNKAINTGLETSKKAIEKGLQNKKDQTVKKTTAPADLDVKKFQDWLDTNKPGWATGYKDGILKQGQNGGGYGKFGPRTTKQWNDPKVKEEYLASIGKSDKSQVTDVEAGGESVMGMTPEDILKNY